MMYRVVIPWRISHILTIKVTFFTFRLRFSVIFCNIKKNRAVDGEGFRYEQAHLSSCREPEAFFFAWTSYANLERGNGKRAIYYPWWLTGEYF